MKFKVGDRVKIKDMGGCFGDAIKIGEIGTILDSYSTNIYYVKFDSYNIGRHSCGRRCREGYGWICEEEMLEPAMSTIAKINKKKDTYCITVRSKSEASVVDTYFNQKGNLEDLYDYWREMPKYDGAVSLWIQNGEYAEFCHPQYYKDRPEKYGKVYEFSDLFPVGSIIMGNDCTYKCTEVGIEKYKITKTPPRYADEGIIGTFKGTPIYADGGVVSIHDLPTNEWYNPIGERRFREQMEQAKKLVTDYMKGKRIEFKNGSFIIVKDEEENNLKFTFYVTEGTRVDKSCNGTIPTITTTVEANSYSRTAPVGTATCDKADYDMRQGVLEALANMYCDGDFDKVFNKAVKRNELADKKKRTCTYCGQVFDTVEEKQVHEA